MNFRYLKHIALPYYDKDIVWSICPYTGSLLKGKAEKKTNQEIIPLKVLQALEYCNQPYLCKVNNKIEISSSNVNLISKITKMHDRILKIGNNRFYMTRLYSSFKNLMFENTNEAITYINSLPPQVEYKHQLCLQRAFLSSKVSKNFINDGVIFIGAFLPTGDMHAWIIENGKQPDFDDRGWINYRPLLAFYH
jgi:hypothetical protein